MQTYFDHNATSPLHPQVLEAMMPYLALNAIRASFGMSNTLQEVDALVSKLQGLINKLPTIIRQSAV
jgi:cysteine sulfinate desulfinase/cysteine desulfurase-like protein